MIDLQNYHQDTNCSLMKLRRGHNDKGATYFVWIFKCLLHLYIYHGRRFFANDNVIFVSAATRSSIDFNNGQGRLL